MKTSRILLATLLALGLSGSAFAQTTPTTTTPNSPSNTNGKTPVTTGTASPDTQPYGQTQGTTPTTEGQVGTMKDGSSISNNRDRLSPGTGTPATMADDRKAEKQAKKTKMKSKP